MDRRVWCVAAITVFLGLCATFAFIGLSGGKTSVLVRIANDEPVAAVARSHDAEFRFVQHDTHYDGTYFYTVGIDPLARGPAHTLIDHGAYRYGHGGLGLLAWLFSLGRASAVPNALLALNLAGAAAATIAVALIAKRSGASPWWGLLISLNPGVLYALTVDTTEPVAIAFAALGILAWMARKPAATVTLLSAAVLCKEPFLIVPVGILVWEIWTWWRERSEREISRDTAYCLIPILVFVLWQAYLHRRFGVWPIRDSDPSLTLSSPFKGWYNAVRSSVALALGQTRDAQLGAASLPMLIMLGAGTLIASIRAVRIRSVFSPMILMFAALTFCLGSLVILYPKDLLRYSAISFALLPAAFVRSERLGSGEHRADVDLESG